MKCTKIYNARAQPLFCSLNLLFSDVPVAVAVVVYFLNSLMARERKLVQRLVNDLFLSRFLKLITISDCRVKPPFSNSSGVMWTGPCSSSFRPG